jgi:pimeloyl-ACP methyl ester carboxylesterase
MKNIIKKVIKGIRNTIIVILGLALLFLVGVTIWNRILCVQEDKALEQVGTDVNVDGKKIRVSVSGEGAKTIVLLSGMGTASPIIDFKPLADKLCNDYKVVTIEYAGYGLSDDTNEERTNEAFVEEIRSTLKQLEVKPPYILMPHSISGIYSLQYVTNYPDEVEAVIGIDCSVPNQGKCDEMVSVSKGLYNLARFMDATGLTRLSYLSGVEHLQDMQASGSYSKEDMNNVTSLFNRCSINKARFSEVQNFMNNCEQLYDVKYPVNIPVLFILSTDTCETTNKEMKKRGFEQTWEGLHEEVISNPEIQKITYLDGKHYLQWTQSETIANLTKEFLKVNQINQQ